MGTNEDPFTAIRRGSIYTSFVTTLEHVNDTRHLSVRDATVRFGSVLEQFFANQNQTVT